jgi:hypothetical protein
MIMIDSIPGGSRFLLAIAGVVLSAVVMGLFGLGKNHFPVAAKVRSCCPSLPKIRYLTRLTRLS